MADPNQQRTAQAKRVRFREMVVIPGMGGGGTMGWPAMGEPAKVVEVTRTPQGLERNGVFVPWANVACVEWVQS